MKQRRVVSHKREFLADSLTPVAVYRRLLDISPVRFLLESVTGGEQVSRFSFLGAGPKKIYRVYDDRLEVQDMGPDLGSGTTTRAGERRALPGSPLDALRQVLAQVRAEPSSIPFAGGLVGYFGYDVVRLLEHLPDRPPDPFSLPIALLARFDNVLVFDHALQRVIAVANEIEDEIPKDAALDELDRLSRLLDRGSESSAVLLPDQRPPLAPTAPPSLSGDEYQSAVRAAKEYIAAGDIFQVVLARRWRVQQPVDPLALYRALRMVNPSPYMVLLETPDVTLVGASPEMLVRKTGRRLEFRPIAGTRPRGRSPEDDRRLAEELLADPKERAEHVMLVDLGRNDLGRVALPGAVTVESFMQVEYYSHVMHLVSSVVAEQAPNESALDALLACFPAGTLSGAPKIRAMEIIDELEPEARGVYGGAVGYFSYSGDMDTCITIRTLAVHDGQASITAGAGIVADSDPAREEEESENKAAALLEAIALAASLEAADRASAAAAGGVLDGLPAGKDDDDRGAQTTTSIESESSP